MEYGRRGNLDVYRLRGATEAHSAWIKILAENGVFGILLFGGFISSFTYVGWRRRQAGFLVSAF